MEKLWRLFCHVGNSLDLDDTLATFDRELRGLIEYASISIHLKENGLLTPAYMAGPEFQRLPALEIHRPLRHVAVNGLGELRTAMAVPLDQTGVLAVYRRTLFSQLDLETVMAAAPKLLAAVENALRYRSAAQQAGLGGAGALFQKLDAELARCARQSASLAVLACRIEGASAGREATYQRLRGSCREYDFAGAAGDEFVLVLAGFTPRDFPEKRARIEAMAAASGVSATVSAAFFPDDGKDAEDLLAVASRRLHG